MSTDDNLLEGVPDGITVKDKGSNRLSFYTGRWEIELSREEVMGLVDSLGAWLERAHEARKPVSRTCPECHGEGRWFDGSHGSSRHCKDCDGTGKIE